MASFKCASFWYVAQERFKNNRLLGSCISWRLVGSLVSQYILSSLIIPKKGQTRLEEIQRDFMWENGPFSGKIHIGKLGIVWSEKTKGGLGVRRLLVLKNALLETWLWRFSCELNYCWRRVHHGEYGETVRSWCSDIGQDSFGGNLCKEISRRWDDFQTSISIGNNQTTEFWTNKWCGKMAISFYLAC